MPRATGSQFFLLKGLESDLLATQSLYLGEMSLLFNQFSLKSTEGLGGELRKGKVTLPVFESI